MLEYTGKLKMLTWTDLTHCKNELATIIRLISFTGPLKEISHHYLLCAPLAGCAPFVGYRGPWGSCTVGSPVCGVLGGHCADGGVVMRLCGC